MNFREHIDTLIFNNADKEAFVELTDKILSSKPEAWMLIARGKIYWWQGKVSDAMNDYYAANELEPDGIAKQLIENANDIMKFRCTDLINP